MRFEETPIPGVFHINAEPIRDERGHFARLYCPGEFRRAGIEFTSVQINHSLNLKRLTLRGLHFQQPPNAEAKIVRVTHGRVWDVCVDLRQGPEQGTWHSVELDATKMNAVFLPEGIAHGFLSLTDNAQVLYQMGRAFTPGHGRGIRWDDPDLAIPWPEKPSVISDEDLALPLLREAIVQ